METPSPTGSGGVATGERLVSLDALRGFDMFWIAGADAIGDALHHFGGGRLTQSLAVQLDHVDWAGFHFYDMIFPTFLFMMGVAIPFSMARMIEQGGQAAAARRIFRRAILLVLVGILYYGGINHGFSHIRWMGVLQRFGLCYLAGALLYLRLGPRGLVAVCIGLLLGYWALLTFVPVPGVGAGNYAEGMNLSNWIDRMYLPGRKWDGDHDPEGLLSTFPAIGTALIGVLSGMWLRNVRVAPLKRALALGGSGAVLLVLGLAWGEHFPVIKKIWTSSFVLVAGGNAVMALALFYLVIDVWKVRAWATPFVWVGANALTIYLLCNVIEFGPLAQRFVGGEVSAWLDTIHTGLGGLVVALFSAGLCFAIARLLFQRKLFLRL